MTHVYEVFGIFINKLIYKIYLNINEKKNIFGLFIPLILCICFLTRMSNYYIFFIPYIVKCLIEDSVNENPETFQNQNILFSSTITFLIYSFISNQLMES